MRKSKNKGEAINSTGSDVRCSACRTAQATHLRWPRASQFNSLSLIFKVGLVAFFPFSANKILYVKYLA